MTARPSCFLRLSAYVLLALSLGGAGISIGAPEVGEEISVRTIYLTHPVGTTHRITIQGTLGGLGRVLLDSNRCGHNLFGDTTICTSDPVPDIPVQLIQLRVKDPSDQGRRIYRVDGNLRPPGYRYYLVVPHGLSGNYRLAIVTDKERVRVLSLEELLGSAAPRLSVSPPAPARGSEGDAANGEPTKEPAKEPASESEGRPRPYAGHAEYRAVQDGGDVTITAEGELPGSGYVARLERMPRDFDPPVHGLVIDSPAGAQAGKPVSFASDISFEADGEVRYLFVFDAHGRHRISVKQAE